MHFVATVLVPADAPVTEDAVAEAMRPYSEEDGENRSGWWDWWVIGGRWTGRWAEGYDPTEDPENREECFLCNGTGRRDDEAAREWRRKNPDYTCNGCEGTGRKLKHPPQWRRVALDERPAAEVVDLYTSYSLVTPDGAWHKETWDGDAWVPDEDWPATYRRELSKHLGMRAVLVDYHS